VTGTLACVSEAPVIRPIESAEALEYLGVLPFVNGLAMWEPAPAAWHGGSAAWPRPRVVPVADRESLTTELWAPDFHPQAAFVGGELVGASATLSLQITLPGGRFLPVAGVTATAVIATHRRRGLLRAMMQAMFDAALDRGEVAAALSASEGGIYGRFGFGPATMRARWELERTHAAFRQSAVDDGVLKLVNAQTARAAWPALHEQVRRTRTGEISARAGQWDGLSDDPVGDDGPMRFVAHYGPDGQVDGLAHYTLPWSPQPHGVGTLVVGRLEAVTPEAYRSLWGLLLDFDLTRLVIAPSRPVDEPLRWMLRDPRAMRITRQSDNLWLRLLDVPAALQSRAYTEQMSLVFAIVEDEMCPANAGTWELTTGPDGARCVRCGLQPSLSIDVAALGMLFLGGGSAALLAAAGRIREHRAGGVDALSRLFRRDPPPFNALGF
jgi:predicted acetyltransferase